MDRKDDVIMEIRAYGTSTTSCNVFAPATTGLNRTLNSTDAMEPAITTRTTPLDVNVKNNNFDAINWYKIKDFDIIGDKVMKVLFYDGKTVKVVCHEDDVFDIKRGLFLAMAKHQLKDTHTIEGIEHEATQFSYLKGYNKIVDDAIKAHDKKLKELKKQKQQEEEKLRIKENKKRKHAEYLKRREEKRINTQAQAVLRGLQMYDETISEDRTQKQNTPACENTDSNW